jgi:hypothetical protein
MLAGVLQIAPGQVDAQSSQIPENPLTIDEKWVIMVQDDNHKSLEVRETTWFNNTGDAPYDGNVYFWLPQNSKIIANCCGGSPDMLCVEKPDGYHACLNTNGRLGSNIVSANPFYILSPHLTYFGQSETIIVNGTLQPWEPPSGTRWMRNATGNGTGNGTGNETGNGGPGGNQTQNGNQTINGTIDDPSNNNQTINDTGINNEPLFEVEPISMEIIIGGSSNHRNLTSTNSTVEYDVTLSSERDIIGASRNSIGRYPYYIEINEKVIIQNNANISVAANLSLNNVPDGWEMEFHNEDNFRINIVNLTTDQKRELTLTMQIPSHVYRMFLEYSVDLSVAGDSSTKNAIFEKETLYDINTLYPVVYHLSDDTVQISDNLGIMRSLWNDQIDRNEFVTEAFNVEPDEKLEIPLEWTPEDDSTSDSSFMSKLFLYIFIAIIIIVPIVLLFIVGMGAHRLTRKGLERVANRGKNQPRRTSFQDDGGSRKGPTKVEQVKSLHNAIKNLDIDYKQGNIPEPIYLELKEKYKQKFKDMESNKNGSSKNSEKRIEELTYKKKTMLKTISQLESDYKNGEIPKELYDELSSGYKKEAVNILKELDQLKKL